MGRTPTVVQPVGTDKPMKLAYSLGQAARVIALFRQGWGRRRCNGRWKIGCITS
jgi:hypothetical protein